jgi:aryl-alcohol dehydrogenase-like predicted oxidoreductase
LVALQIEYSLIERTVERELIPMARELGLGVVPWSPLASGVLTGKYTQADLDPLAQLEDNLGALDVTFTEDQLASLEKVSGIELGFPHDFLARPMTRNVMFGGIQLEAASR